MQVSLGTFNLNNLFSRWNLYVEVPGVSPARPAWLVPPKNATDEMTVTVSMTADGPRWRWRDFAGRHVYGKSREAQQQIADRIKSGDADVWALQEVESDTALDEFAGEFGLTGAGYVHKTLLPGNDPRAINVAVLSRLPLGAITSWRFTPDPAQPDQPVFSRDLLQAEIMTADRSHRLLTLFVTHLKSQVAETAAEQAAATERRRRQAVAIKTILSRLGDIGPYAVAGDMNTAADAPELGALAESGLKLELGKVRETSPYDEHDPNRPAGPAWTYRFKPPHEPARYSMYDQIWVPRTLAAQITDAWIVRRHHREGDGSDHDPAVIQLDLP